MLTYQSEFASLTITGLSKTPSAVYVIRMAPQIPKCMCSFILSLSTTTLPTVSISPLFGHVCVCAQSCLLFATPWTVARQAPLSTGISRLEYWSGLPCLPPGDHPRSGGQTHISCVIYITGGFFRLDNNKSIIWGFILFI